MVRYVADSISHFLGPESLVRPALFPHSGVIDLGQVGVEQQQLPDNYGKQHRATGHRGVSEIAVRCSR